MVLYADLVRGMETVTPNAPRNPSLSVIKSDKPMYYAGTKLLRFFGRVRSSMIPTKKGSHSLYMRPGHYDIEVDFKNVEPNTGLNLIEIQQGYPPRPSLKNNDIMVRCSCLNYRFRGDFANRRVKAATGSRFPRYFAPPPHLNDDTPMICKHIASYVDWLLKNNFITE